MHHRSTSTLKGRKSHAWEWPAAIAMTRPVANPFCIYLRLSVTA